jgi:glycerol-3-phosphate dehydrogenase
VIRRQEPKANHRHHRYSRPCHLQAYPTARSAFQVARKHQITTPVIDEVHAMLYEGKNVAQAVRDLMSRDLKPE